VLLLPHQLGFFYADGTLLHLSRRVLWAMVAVGLGGLVGRAGDSRPDRLTASVGQRPAGPRHLAGCLTGTPWPMVRSSAVDRSTAARSRLPSGLAPIVLAGATLFVMAVVAASPGSPYQPILTPDGQPSGPLRDLAVRLGLDRIHGNPQLLLATVVSVVAVGAFLLLIRACFRGLVSVRAVVALVVGAHVALLFVPLLFSRDVYSYAYYGRIAGVYGANPYVQTPLDYSGDLLWNYVGPKWVDTPAVYGPAWTASSAVLSRVLPRPADLVEFYRFLAIAASLLTCAVIVWVARELRPERVAFALATFGANPVVIFHAAGGGHVDLLVALAIVSALAFVVRGRELPSIGILAVGALMKATVALPLLFLLVWCVARRDPADRRRTLLTHGGLAGTIGLAFAVPYLQLQDPTLGLVELMRHEGWLAPSAAFQRVFTFLSFGLLGWVPRFVFGVVLVVVLAWIGAAVWRRAADRRTEMHMPSASSTRELGAAWAWALVTLLLVGPVLLPWYVVPALPLAALLPHAPRRALIATSALMAVSLWSAEPLRYPGGFDVDLFVGRCLVTPALLYFLWDVLRELRSRVEIGLPFAARAPEPSPLTLPREPVREEAVAAPTG
jgi:alpha-1,6-mannosyltransferase